MIFNHKIFISILSNKNYYLQKIKELEDKVIILEQKVYGSYSSPLKTEEYIDKNGKVKSALIPRISSPQKIIVDTQHDSMLLEDCKKDIVFLKTLIKRTDDILGEIKNSNELLYKLVVDKFINGMTYTKLAIDYGFSCKEATFKYLKFNLIKFFKTGSL